MVFYTSQRPIGAKGDFITAPEISQLFGELIGIWMLAVWQQSGRPRSLSSGRTGAGPRHIGKRHDPGQ